MTANCGVLMPRCVFNRTMKNQNTAIKTAGPSDGAGVVKYTKARQLAARLNVSSRTIFRWADAGKIHRYKLNERVVLFSEDEILAFIAAARVSHGGAS